MKGHVFGTLVLLALGLTPPQERGKAIFFHGESSAGRAITAVVGTDSDAVPAAILPCANCHGEDGHGRPEGGLRPADITSESLSRVAALNGRTRPPYTRALLKRAITMGFDSGRHELNTAMPRYSMTQEDANDLLAYLELLGHEPQPGVSDDSIRIRIVGDVGSLKGTRVYGRQIELVRDGDAFLVIDATQDGTASVEAAEHDRIPTIVLRAPAALSSRYAFSLTAGEEDQLEALRAYGRRRGAEPVVVTDCAALPRTAALLLMTAKTASKCELGAFPASFDRRVIVAAPLPPSERAMRAAAAAALAITTELLARLGRDVTRTALVDALEHVYRADSHELPPLTWSPNRHTATRAAWLMTLDLGSQRLIGEPGWVSPE